MENIVLNNSDPESSIVKHNAEEKIMMKIEEFRKVISGNRNLWMTKYPYGYKAKERFQLCGQL